MAMEDDDGLSRSKERDRRGGAELLQLVRAFRDVQNAQDLLRGASERIMASAMLRLYSHYKLEGRTEEAEEVKNFLDELGV